MEPQNTGQRSLLSDLGSEQDATDLSQANDAAKWEKVLTSLGRSGTDARAGNIQLPSKLDAIGLEPEEILTTLAQKEVTN